MDIEGLRQAADNAAGNMNRARQFLTDSSQEMYPTMAGNFEQASKGVETEMAGLANVVPAAKETADQLLERTGKVHDLFDGLPSEEVSQIVRKVGEAGGDCMTVINYCIGPLGLATEHRGIADELQFTAAALAISPDIKAGSRSQLDASLQALENYKEGL